MKRLSSGLAKGF